MFKLDFEKAREPEIKLPTSVGSSKKQKSSRKTSTSALLSTPKPLTVCYEYGYNAATIAPSKQTATQLKGRNKDAEVAENAVSVRYSPSFRMPNFVQSKTSGRNYGNIIHTIMQ